jgi:hypothetical protein
MVHKEESICMILDATLVFVMEEEGSERPGQRGGAASKF